MWAINDEWDPLPGARIEWRIVDAGGGGVGQFAAAMEADSSKQAGEVEWKAGAPGPYQLQAAVVNAVGSSSENIFEFEVIP